MLSASVLARSTPQIRLGTRQLSNVISGPPKVRMSFAEKAVHGLVIAGAMCVVPGWVLANIKNYRAK